MLQSTTSPLPPPVSATTRPLGTLLLCRTAPPKPVPTTPREGPALPFFFFFLELRFLEFSASCSCRWAGRDCHFVVALSTSTDAASNLCLPPGVQMTIVPDFLHSSDSKQIRRLQNVVLETHGIFSIFHSTRCARCWLANDV